MHLGLHARIGMLILCMKAFFLMIRLVVWISCCFPSPRVCGDFAARRMREPLAFGNIAPSAACIPLMRKPQ